MYSRGCISSYSRRDTSTSYSSPSVLPSHISLSSLPQFTNLAASGSLADIFYFGILIEYSGCKAFRHSESAQDRLLSYTKAISTMAHISAWQTFALLPPAPFPCGYFWDTEEIRHQEHLHRVSHAQFLYSHRTDSPEAMRVYKDFISEQNAWMAEQEELIEREAQVAMKARMDRASRWAEEWRRLEGGETVEDVLMVNHACSLARCKHLISPRRQGQLLSRNHPLD